MAKLIHSPTAQHYGKDKRTWFMWISGHSSIDGKKNQINSCTFRHYKDAFL